jgi:hypothetical protein
VRAKRRSNLVYEVKPEMLIVRMRLAQCDESLRADLASILPEGKKTSVLGQTGQW